MYNDKLVYTVVIWVGFFKLFMNIEGSFKYDRYKVSITINCCQPNLCEAEVR